MRINVLLPGFGITGGVRVVFEYANRLSERGHDVTLLAPPDPPQMVDPSPGRRAAAAVTAVKAKSSRILGAADRLVTEEEVEWFDVDVPTLRVPSFSPNLTGFLEAAIPDADVTVATTWETAYTVAALGESKGEKAYFVQSYEIWDTWNDDDAWERVASVTDDPASWPVEMADVTPRDARARKQKRLVDRSYELPLSKITISSWLSELLETKFDQEVVDVVPNSVDHSTFYPDPTDESDALSVLLLYQDFPLKGKREARQLMEALRTADARVHTFGSSTYGSVASELPEHVTHHTDVTGAQLRHLYSNADVYVRTAWLDGFALTPLEAMACECAVVATNVGAVPDYADDGRVVSVVPPRDGTALVEAVRELLADDEKRARLQQRGREYVRSYTWDDATARFERALRTVVEGRVEQPA